MLPTLSAVAPSASSIFKSQALSVSIVVGAVSGKATPTGSVVLTSGSYSSASATLRERQGNDQHSQQGSLAVGKDTLDGHLYARHCQLIRIFVGDGKRNGDRDGGLHSRAGSERRFRLRPQRLPAVRRRLIRWSCSSAQRRDTYRRGQSDPSLDFRQEHQQRSLRQPSRLARAQQPSLLTVNVPATASMLSPRKPFGAAPLPTALGLIVLPLALLRRKRLTRRGKTTWLFLLATIGTLSIAGLIGCGGGGGSQSPPPPPQSHTYTLTVTAASGSLSYLTPLTLIVK